jgi:pre-mRNA-splicing factor CWC22
MLLFFFAVSIQEVGLKLIEVSPRGIHAVFETLRSVLHSGKIAPRVQYMIEVMFAIRKDQFKVCNISKSCNIKSHPLSNHFLSLSPSLSLWFC